MKTKITDKAMPGIVRDVPKDGYNITWDSEIPGFGVRVTAAGVVSFILNYRIAGWERRYTIGRYGEVMKAAQAREKARVLSGQISEGHDPLAAKQALREEPTIDDLLDDYLDSVEYAKKRPATQRDYRKYGERFLRPAWCRIRVKAIERRDVDTLHGKLKGTPYQANRVLAFASLLFSYAIERQYITSNPAKGVERYHEEKRTRFLGNEDTTEMERFMVALDGYRDQNAADALRLCLMTGARSGEVMTSSWENFNLTRGIWTKPSAHTKQKKTELLKLNTPTIELLTRMKPKNAHGPVFPGRDGEAARKGLRRPFLRVCKAAGLVEEYEVPAKRERKDGKVRMLKRYRATVRIHDLRHTFGSYLASDGVPLKVIGKLLGHTQAATTERYAHLLPGAEHEATERFGKIIEFNRKPSATHAAS